MTKKTNCRRRRFPCERTERDRDGGLFPRSTIYTSVLFQAWNTSLLSSTWFHCKKKNFFEKGGDYCALPEIFDDADAEESALRVPDQRHASFSQQDGSTVVEPNTQKESEGQRKPHESTSAALCDAMKEFCGGADITRLGAKKSKAPHSTQKAPATLYLYNSINNIFCVNTWLMKMILIY